MGFVDGFENRIQTGPSQGITEVSHPKLEISEIGINGLR